VVNVEFIVAGIRNLMLVNYGVSRDLIDVESLVDPTLSMSENWFLIKPEVLAVCSKNHKAYFG